MRVLLVTNMYPSSDRPASGVFVRDQVESIRQLGVDLDVLLIDGRKSTLNYLWGFPRLWKRVLTQKYDLVHAHYVFSGVIARAQWRCPVVLTHHGIEVLRGGQSRLSRIVTPWFDQVIVVSPEMQQRLGHSNIQVIPCGVDLDRFQPAPREEARAALGLPQDKKLVLWAGDETRPEKRFDLVKSAVNLLKADDPSVELVLLSGRPHSQVSRYMNACDVLLLVSDAEGSPMVVKEAMACNLPVVATPVGDVPQITGKVQGYYLCSQEPQDIADKAKLVLAECKRAQGREAVRRLSLEAIAQQVMLVYQQALEQSAGRRVARAGQ